MFATEQEKQSIKGEIFEVCRRSLAIEANKTDLAELQQAVPRHMPVPSKYYLSSFYHDDGDVERAINRMKKDLFSSQPQLEDNVVSVASLFSEYEKSYSSFISDKGTRRFDYSPFFTHVLESNVLDDFLNTVPIRLGHITTTPGQVFAALWANARLPDDVVSSYISTEQTAENSTEERKRMRILPAQRFVRCKINTAMPGSGKTAQALLSCLPPLLSASIFEEFKADAAQKFPYAFHAKSLGLEDGYAKPLVRTAIFATTQATKRQTMDAVKTLLAGTGVEVWNEIGGRTLRDAYEANNNSPKVWVLPTNATLWGLLRNSEKYQFLTIIFDELNFSSSGRGNQAEPLSTLILQATPDALRASHSGTVQALVGRMDPTNNDCWLNYVHVMLPESVRALVNRGALDKMPLRVHRYSIRCKLTSVFGRHESNALVPRSLESYLLQMLEPHASDRSRISPDNFKLLASKLRGVVVTIPLFASVLKESMTLVPLLGEPDADGRIRRRRMVIERLVETVEGILGGGSDCPVLLEPLTTETATVLPCCGNLISRSAAKAVHRSSGRCPLCREKLEVVSGLGEAVEEPVKVCPLLSINLFAPIKDAVATLSAARLPPIETVVGVIASIIHSIPDARIILCASELALGVSQASEDLLAMLAKYAPTMIVCSTTGKKKFKSTDFNNKKKFTAPRLLLLDLSIRSSNAAGLDLPASDATVLLGNSTAHMCTQACSRMLRMQDGPQADKILVSVI